MLYRYTAACNQHCPSFRAWQKVKFQPELLLQFSFDFGSHRSLFTRHVSLVWFVHKKKTRAGARAVFGACWNSVIDTFVVRTAESKSTFGTVWQWDSRAHKCVCAALYHFKHNLEIYIWILDWLLGIVHTDTARSGHGRGEQTGQNERCSFRFTHFVRVFFALLQYEYVLITSPAVRGIGIAFINIPVFGTSGLRCVNCLWLYQPYFIIGIFIHIISTILLRVYDEYAHIVIFLGTFTIYGCLFSLSSTVSCSWNFKFWFSDVS